MRQRRSTYAVLGVPIAASSLVLFLLVAASLVYWFLESTNGAGLTAFLPDDDTGLIRVVGPVLALLSAAGFVPLWRSRDDPKQVVGRITRTFNRPELRMSFVDADAHDRILAAVEEAISCLSAGLSAGGGADLVSPVARAHPADILHPVARRHLLKAEEDLRKAKLKARRWRGEDTLYQKAGAEACSATDPQPAVEFDELVARALEHVKDALAAQDAELE